MTVRILDDVKEKAKAMKKSIGSFDWKKGLYRQDGIPLWARLCLHGLLALIMSLGPPILTYLKLFPGAYPLISLDLPIKKSGICETLRAIWLIGIPYGVYVIIQAWLCFIPWFTYAMARYHSYQIDDAVRHSLDQTWSIRKYLGCTGASAALAVLARLLYPLPLVKMIVVTPGKTASSPDDLVAVGQNIQTYLQNHPHFFLQSASLAVAIICGIVLVEKLLLKAVAHRFHSHSLESRIQTNKQARKITRSLRNYAMATLKMQKKPSLAGPLIFDFIQPSANGVITQEDLERFMDAELASKYFAILETDHEKSLNRERFLAAIDAVYHEQAAIDRAFLDQSHILERFDKLMMIIVWLLAFLAVMMVMDPPIKFLMTFAVTLLGGLMFMFKDTAKKAFDSIVFVIFTHPFDADDWVMIKDSLYQVHQIGLWTTSFLTDSGKLVYMANRLLINLPITNLRRSPIMNENIAFSILPTTSPAKIAALEQSLLAWVKENQRDYLPSISVRGFKIIDKEHMKMEINLSHRSNFNDQYKKDMRSRNFVIKLKESINELGIELSPPVIA